MSWILALYKVSYFQVIYLLDIFDSVTLLDIERDRLAGKGFDENLHFIYLVNK